MTIVREGRFPNIINGTDRDDNSPRKSVDRTDPHAEKPTKALIGVAILVAIGSAMYGLGTKQPGAHTPSALVMARSNQQH